MTMTRRRFLYLAATLVAVNSFFWLAQSGFALPKAIINQFFGGNLIRAEVLVASPGGDAGLADRPRRDHGDLGHERDPPREGRDLGHGPGRPERPGSGACALLERGAFAAPAAGCPLPPGEPSGHACAGRGRCWLNKRAHGTRGDRGSPASRRGRGCDRPSREGLSRAAGRLDGRLGPLRRGRGRRAATPSGAARRPRHRAAGDRRLRGVPADARALEGADRDADRARRGAGPRRRPRARRRRLRVEAVLAARARSAHQGDPAPRREPQRGRGARGARHRAAPRLARRHRRPAARSS